jgi:hypothetical protein
MYSKTILMLQDKRITQYLKMFLGKRKKPIESEEPLLTDIDAVRNELFITRNTSNLRKAFGQFIKTQGFPFLLIIDYVIDFGLMEKEDPDKRKVLRTFLISFIILANARGFDGACAHMVLLCSKKDSHIVKVYRNNPAILLKQLKTNDERVNTLIRSYIQNPEKLKQLLNIYPLVKPESGNYAEMQQELNRIIDQVEGSVKKARGAGLAPEETDAPEEPPAPEMINEDHPPADVICRATRDRIVVNGKVRPISEEERNKYPEKNIFLEGAITVKTATEVCDRILQLFQTMTKLNPFRKEERIFIRVPDTSLIDGAFPSAVGSFLNGSLNEYTGISIDLGPENSRKLQGSRGIIAIKDYLVKNI